MRPLTYRIEDGAVLALHEAYVGLRQPSRPLPAAIAELTGLSDAALAGRTIDVDAVGRLLAGCAVVAAHSARFDRPFLEAFMPAFAEKPWVCTVEDAEWAAEGLESAKLCFVAAMGFGFFFDGHRALDDCDAVAEILSRQAPRSGGTVLAKVLSSARRGRWRLRIAGSDFEARHALKADLFRWDPGAGQGGKGWYKDFASRGEAEAVQTAASPGLGPRARCEIAHLAAGVRFSGREGL